MPEQVCGCRIWVGYATRGPAEAARHGSAGRRRRGEAWCRPAVLPLTLPQWAAAWGAGLLPGCCWRGRSRRAAGRRRHGLLHVSSWAASWGPGHARHARKARAFVACRGPSTPRSQYPAAPPTCPVHRVQSREAVRRVAELFPTAIVSGRGREKVESFVQLRQLFYAGSHGMDIVGPRSSGSSSSGGGSPGAGSSATTSRTQSGECGDAAGTAAGTAVNGAAVASEAAAAVASRSADAAENEERFTFQPAAQYEPLMNAVYDELTGAVVGPGALLR